MSPLGIDDRPNDLLRLTLRFGRPTIGPASAIPRCQGDPRRREPRCGGPYARTIRMGGRPGHLRVEPGEDGWSRPSRASRPPVCPRSGPPAAPVRLRRPPRRHRRLPLPRPASGAPRRAAPGLRLPGAWDPFETGCRAILGQQVSVAAARRLAGRLVKPSARLSRAAGLDGCSPPRGSRRGGCRPRPQHAPGSRRGDPRPGGGRARREPDLFARGQPRRGGGPVHHDPRDRPVDGAVHRDARPEAAGCAARRGCRPAPRPRPRDGAAEPAALLVRARRGGRSAPTPRSISGAPTRPRGPLDSRASRPSSGRSTGAYAPLAEHLVRIIFQASGRGF